MRIFSGFKVAEGVRNGTTHYNKVPVRYADMQRMVAHILTKGSENMVNSTPFMACNVTSLLVARDRTQDPMNISKVQVAERQYDASTGSYGSEDFPGNLYTTDRYMPVPYNLTMNLDIWSGNTDQKLQLLEQILILFNPSIQLQQGNNPLDWTNLYEVELTDIQWSNRSVPAGVDETIDVATLTFILPIWLSPPAKVKRQKIINTIITNIYDTGSVGDLEYNPDMYDFFRTLESDFELHTISPNNYEVELIGTEAKLYKDNGSAEANWNDLLEVLSPQGSGTANANISIDDIPLTSASTLQLNITNNVDNENTLITGVVSRNVLDSSKLVFNLDVDTLPSTTLTDVTRIVDASKNYPGDGTLDAVATGQRYLLTTEIHGNQWGVTANTNDIIEYNGTGWVVSFNASTSVNQESIHYVKNLYTNKQYKWENVQWTSTYEGKYNPGFWRLNV
jgi:hypothetical protein